MFDTEYAQHNEEVKAVWESFNNKDPIRMPFTLGVNNRMVMLDPKLNVQQYTFENYFNNPDIMAEVSCVFEHHMRHDVYADHEMGMPENGWTLSVDSQNLHECGWLGAKVMFPKNNVPFVIPFLHDDNKYALLDKPIPELFANFEQLSLKTYNHMSKLKESGWTFMDLPIKRVQFVGTTTDGPMTLACMLRGTENFCADLIEDPVYAVELMDYLVEAAAFRLKGLRKFLGREIITDGFSFADDSVALMSLDMYEEMVYPLHKKLISEMVHDFETSRNSIHLCGDAQRFFTFIKEKLRVVSFDTGFPIDFSKLAKELGPGIDRLYGGVRVDDLMLRTPDEIALMTRDIINKVVPYTDRFIMREANNLSPRTPLENIYSMYQTVREYGRYKY